MASVLELCQSAYKQANLDQSLSSLTPTLTTEYPYTIALDLLNTVIREMNRKGRYWFTETSTALAYGVGVASYDLGALGVDPRAIVRLRCELNDYELEVKQSNWRSFQSRYLSGVVTTAQPRYFSKYNDMLYLSSIPNQDYTLTLYHYDDIPLAVDNADILPMPISDEDVLIEGVYAYLCQRLGRPDFNVAYASYMNKVEDLLGKTYKDAGMPKQMPAAF